MFNQNAKRQMVGAKEFFNRRLDITDTHKGKKAWSTFIERLKSNHYEKCNSFTTQMALNRAELEKSSADIPCLGTSGYNSLKIKKLLFDMERRFE